MKFMLRFAEAQKLKEIIEDHNPDAWILIHLKNEKPYSQTNRFFFVNQFI